MRGGREISDVAWHCDCGGDMEAWSLQLSWEGVDEEGDATDHSGEVETSIPLFMECANDSDHKQTLSGGVWHPHFSFYTDTILYVLHDILRARGVPEARIMKLLGYSDPDVLWGTHLGPLIDALEDDARSPDLYRSNT